MRVKTWIGEALQILSAMGIPTDGMTERRRERMAKAFLVVAALTPKMTWRDVKDSESGFQLLSRQVIAAMNTDWGEQISPGSYDDIRRKDLLLPVQALVVLPSARNPNANTNDGTRGFALSPLAAKAIRSYGTTMWPAALAAFNDGRPTLAAQLSRTRNLARVPVTLSGGKQLSFGAGAHNELQKAVIESILPIFAPGAHVLYVGDAANKGLHVDEATLKSIDFFELAHDKLPDVVACMPGKNWLFLIEAVTTANPITELRRLSLMASAKACKASLIFVTAFPDRDTYRKFARDIAWETEVWIANSPDHMIHFNGDKFLGPHG